MANEVLRAFASQYFPQKYLDEFLTEIDKTGTISDETLTRAGIKKKSTVTFIKDQVSKLVPKSSLKDLSQAELKRIVGTDTPYNKDETVNEADLTDEGLSTRKGIFEQIGKTKGVVEPDSVRRILDARFDTNNVHFFDTRRNQKSQAGEWAKIGIWNPATAAGAAIAGHLWGEGGDDDKIEDVAFRDQVKNAIEEFVTTNQRLPDHGEMRDFLNARGVNGEKAIGQPAFQNFLSDPNVKSEFSTLADNFVNAPETTADVKRIEDLLGTRATSRQRESDISGFIDRIPDDLAAGRNNRSAMMRELGGRQFQDLAPQVLERENALGRLNSGAAGDVLASTQADIQGGIESSEAQMLSDDEAFYFNASYQNQVRKLMEGQTDLTNSINTERQNIRGQQEQRFQTGQVDLSRNLQNDLLMQKYENQIRMAQTARERGQSIANSRSKSAGYAGIGSGAASGAMAGGMAGGPWGALIGAGVGAGSAALPMLFGGKR